MLKILHAADLHLDSPLKGLERYDGAPVDELRDATRRALKNLVELAIEQQVAVVVIAGDVYDGDWRDHNTGLFFVKQLSRLREAGIATYLISGNHDAQNKMTRSLRLPPNPAGDAPQLSANGPETRRLDDLGLAVHGQSFANASEQSNLALRYPAAVRGWFNLGVLHTSLEGDQQHDPYAPCSVDDLRRKEYDYWALGHIHKRREVVERPWVVYSGNIQGRHVRETGAKGCYLISVDEARRATLEFKPLDVVRWHWLPVDCADSRTIEEAGEQVAASLRSGIAECGDRLLAARVELRGGRELHSRWLSDPDSVTAEVRSRSFDFGQQAWIEKVLFTPVAADESTGAGLAADTLDDLLAVCDAGAADPLALREAAPGLNDMIEHLPAELKDAARSLDALAYDNPDWLRARLAEVRTLLHSRLVGGNS